MNCTSFNTFLFSYLRRDSLNDDGYLCEAVKFSSYLAQQARWIAVAASFFLILGNVSKYVDVRGANWAPFGARLNVYLRHDSDRKHVLNPISVFSVSNGNKSQRKEDGESRIKRIGGWFIRPDGETRAARPVILLDGLFLPE